MWRNGVSHWWVVLETDEFVWRQKQKETEQGPKKKPPKQPKKPMHAWRRFHVVAVSMGGKGVGGARPSVAGSGRSGKQSQLFHVCFSGDCARPNSSTEHGRFGVLEQTQSGRRRRTPFPNFPNNTRRRRRSTIVTSHRFGECGSQCHAFHSFLVQRRPGISRSREPASF